MIPKNLAGLTIRQRIQIQYDTIRDCEAIVRALRAMCDHRESHIGWYSYRVGAQTPKRLCDECDAVVGDPSLEELKAFDENWARAVSSQSPVVIVNNR